MTDWNSMDAEAALENAWSMFERESQRLAELGRHWDEATTTVRAKDHSLDMTFDGRGQLTDIVFNPAKYRAMPPAQLASVLIETLRAGQAEAQAKINELMGTSSVPGLDLEGLSTGQIRPDQMIAALLEPVRETLDGVGLDIELPKPGERNRG